MRPSGDCHSITGSQAGKACVHSSARSGSPCRAADAYCAPTPDSSLRRSSAGSFANCIPQPRATVSSRSLWCFPGFRSGRRLFDQARPVFEVYSRINESNRKQNSEYDSILHLGPAQAPDIQRFRFSKEPQRSSNKCGNKSNDHQRREHAPKRCHDQEREEYRLRQ